MPGHDQQPDPDEQVAADRRLALRQVQGAEQLHVTGANAEISAIEIRAPAALIGHRRAMNGRWTTWSSTPKGAVAEQQ
ncbi:hypothetical protein E1161_19315 [Saccharopolyspora aridisoli]|uniref:Uncharacterized protein n=1 Tax=Saccharopolyspora aridisoli TaxID=2530385 RepID=A0A4R4UEV1_9PSEU|nr:hypothetical protein [Saccharopolyspora aridisoli]TDC90258.1 hypothetical protein E1161_19315 [Saccharopolyspora aridisoli]